jgi:hypothetical protein
MMHNKQSMSSGVMYVTLVQQHEKEGFAQCETAGEPPQHQPAAQKITQQTLVQNEQDGSLNVLVKQLVRHLSTHLQTHDKAQQKSMLSGVVHVILVQQGIAQCARQTAGAPPQHQPADTR